MNKGVTWGLIAVALIVGGIIGFSIERSRATTKIEAFKMEMQKKIDSAKMMAKDKTMGGQDEAMMGIGYVMKDGKMLVEENGKMTQMDKDVTLKDGTVVTTSGQVAKKDGTKLTLRRENLFGKMAVSLMRVT